MSLREKLEKVMMAVTFAESGQHDTALKIMEEEKVDRKVRRKVVRRRPRKEMQARVVKK